MRSDESLILNSKTVPVIFSSVCLLIFAFFVTANDNKVKQPANYENITEPLVFDYYTEEIMGTAVNVKYLSSRPGGTVCNIDIHDYLSGNSELLKTASSTRQADIEREEIVFLDAFSAEVEAKAEAERLAKEEAERLAREEAERLAAEQKAAADKQAEEVRKKRVQASQAVTEDTAGKFYVPSIAMPYEEQEYLYNECTKRGLDYFVMLGIIRRESTFNPNIIGGSSTKYYGYFQVNSDCINTVKQYYNDYTLDPLNPYDNILIGVTVMKDQVDATGNLYDGLIAYEYGYYGWLAGDYSTDGADMIMEYSQNYRSQVQ